MINFPKVQQRVQEELDREVGRDKLPSLGAKGALHYTEAVIHEVHRHATIAPLAVHHFPLHETEYAGYSFTRRDMIIPSIYEVHHDPATFPEPHLFNPDRFIDPEDGKFLPHPAVVPYGVGKRECLGKALAKAEVFLFTSCLLQQFSFHPTNSGPPALDDCTLAVARSPNPFKVRITSRL